MISPLISDALQEMQNGDFLPGLFNPYTRVFGDSLAVSGGYIYSIMFAVIFGGLVLKTQSIAMTAVVFLLVMPLVFFIIPTQSTSIFIIFLILIISSIIYKIAIHKGG